MLPFQKLVQTKISEANFPVVSYLPRNRMTRKDVKIISSVLFSSARFSTQLEVKFHCFGMLTHGREQSILKIFWLSFSEHSVDSFKQINKILSYTLKAITSIEHVLAVQPTYVPTRKPPCINSL